MARALFEHVEYELEPPAPAADLESRHFLQIDPEKCTGCGDCEKYCPTAAIHGVIGQAHTIPHPEPCLHCGMCLVHCPAGAIYERYSWLPTVAEGLRDPEPICVAMPAPSVRYTLGEAFDGAWGQNIYDKMLTAFQRLGFRHCWDTEFAADVTIWEEGSCLLKRLDDGGVFPQFSSCCPGWQKYVEYFYPDLIPNLVSVKSPLAINGRLAKTYGADRFDHDPGRMYTVAIMPCIAKKYEALRPELEFGGIRDIDAVLTVREFAALLRRRGINPWKLPPGQADTLMGESSGGTLFGIGGGVLETLCRYVVQKRTGKRECDLIMRGRPGLEGIFEYELRLGKQTLRLARVVGARYFAPLCEEVRAGASRYHFVEFMACAGGCINGGGQLLLPSFLKNACLPEHA